MGEADEPDSGSGTATVEKVKVKRPRLYKVIMHNDDYSTMDFVIMILESVFRMTPSEAMRIMLNIHNSGSGICGIFTKDIAEAKSEIVLKKAKDEGFPLRCSVEPE